MRFLQFQSSPPFHPSLLSTLPHLSPVLWTSRQAASSTRSPEATLCVLLTLLPHPKLLLFSHCVCAHPHPHQLRPGARGGGGWEVMFFFLSLILFFCLPSNLSPFPHQKKRKRQTQIKYLSGTVPLAQAASVCFVLPPSLPGMPPVWTLGPQFHDLFTPIYVILTPFTPQPHPLCLHSFVAP